MQWLVKLLPQQKMQHLGDGNIQAARVEGDLHHNQHTQSATQNIYNTFYLLSPDVQAERAANESKPAPLSESPAPLAEKSTPSEPDATPASTHQPTTPEQLEVLRLMRSSDAAQRYAKYFMHKEFKTIRVKSLDALQCKRTHRYVQVCLQKDAEQRIPGRSRAQQL